MEPMCMCGRRGNSFTQCPSLWHRDLRSHCSTSKHPSLAADLHPLYTSTLSMSKLSTFQVKPLSRVLSQIGLLFQSPTFQRPLFGSALTLWGRVLLSNGQVPACLRKCSCDCTAAEVQRLWEITQLAPGFCCTMASAPSTSKIQLFSGVHWDLDPL